MTKKAISPYIYIAPGLLAVALFIYYPIAENIRVAFFNWNPFSDTKQFLGLQNYVRLFHDPVFYLALKNNTIYALISLLLQVFGSLILAAVLEDSIFRKVAPLLRTVYFIPVLISMTVIGLLFSFVYNPEFGMLNHLLKLAGLGQWTTGWLGNSKTAIYAVITVSQWQSLGYVIMLYIVVIQKIPGDLYEAAKIDGASKIQAFFNVTLPQVKEMMFVASVYTVSGSYLVFNEVYVLTNGGPGFSSQVISTYMYQKAFVNNEMGYASAIANVILLITVMLFLLQKKLFKTGEEG